MPFTPLHFGPGILAKGVSPRHVSLTAFFAANVAIDLEPLYYLVRGEYPIHRFLHTLLGASTAGLLTAVALALVVHVSYRIVALRRVFQSTTSSLGAEFAFSSVLLGAALGAISHPLLDSLVHEDVLPFAPWIPGNPFLGTIPSDSLFDILLTTGAAGAALLLARVLLKRRAA